MQILRRFYATAIDKALCCHVYCPKICVASIMTWSDSRRF